MVFFNRISSNIAQLSRWAIATTLCALVFIANVQPALAFGGSSSKASEGVTQLDKIEQRANEALEKGPRGADEVTARAEGGINGVQGGADASKMETPANSKETTTVADGIKSAIKEMNN